MKISELKHNHSLTDLLKVLIFSLLMLAPLFASVSQMLYATFNKNAYQSYGGNIQPVYETNVVNSQNDLINGNIYTLTINNDDIPSSTNTFAKVKAVYNFPIRPNENIYGEAVDNDSGTFMYLRLYANNTLSVMSSNYQSILSMSAENARYPISFNVVFIELTSTDIIDYTNFSKSDFNIYDNEYNAQSTLDNAFYYGVDQMTKSDLFNWTQNTALYTGIYGMTSNLEIQTPAIAILLTYWTILTIIYVIIDIVLKGFTYITHFLQMKV